MLYYRLTTGNSVLCGGTYGHGYGVAMLMIFLNDHGLDGYSFLAFDTVGAFCVVGRYLPLVWICGGGGVAWGNENSRSMQ